MMQQLNERKTNTDYDLDTLRPGGDGILRVKDFYRGKTILLTGCTGFLAKVILEKILRSSPDFHKIFVLMRPKRNRSPDERLIQVLTSPCFKLLWATHGGKEYFMEWAMKKLVPIQGDLIMNNLGIAPDNRQLITREVQVIINSAASVNFEDPLHDALQINYFGAQRMLNLAKECEHLEIFTHVSTAYVNCNLNNFIEEEIYRPDFDAEMIA